MLECAACLMQLTALLLLQNLLPGTSCRARHLLLNSSCAACVSGFTGLNIGAGVTLFAVQPDGCGWRSSPTTAEKMLLGLAGRECSLASG
jgi:hypothetical protein